MSVWERGIVPYDHKLACIEQNQFLLIEITDEILIFLILAEVELDWRYFATVFLYQITEYALDAVLLQGKDAVSSPLVLIDIAVQPTKTACSVRDSHSYGVTQLILVQSLLCVLLIEELVEFLIVSDASRCKTVREHIVQSLRKYIVSTRQNLHIFIDLFKSVSPLFLR